MFQYVPPMSAAPTKAAIGSHEPPPARSPSDGVGQRSCGEDLQGHRDPAVHQRNVVAEWPHRVGKERRCILASDRQRCHTYHPGRGFSQVPVYANVGPSGSRTSRLPRLSQRER